MRTFLPLILGSVISLTTGAVATAQDELFPLYHGDVYSLDGRTGVINFDAMNIGPNDWGGDIQLNLPRYTLANWQGTLAGHRMDMSWAYGSEFSGWAVGWFNRDYSTYQGILLNRYRFQQNEMTSIGLFRAMGSSQ